MPFHYADDTGYLPKRFCNFCLLRLHLFIVQTYIQSTKSGSNFGYNKQWIHCVFKEIVGLKHQCQTIARSKKCLSTFFVRPTKKLVQNDYESTKLWVKIICQREIVSAQCGVGVHSQSIN